MEKSRTFNRLIFFLCLLQQSVGEIHSMTGNFMGSQGLGLPDYMESIAVDGVTVYYRDSSMTSAAPCPDWFNTTEGRQHWNDINLISYHNMHSMAMALQSSIQQFNQTGASLDINIYQGYARCDLYMNGTVKALLAHAFNGKDFLSFDIDSKVYIASVPQAVMYKRQREKNPILLETTASFYKKMCFDRLKLFLQHVPGVRVKKVPEVKLLQHKSAGTDVLTCHVTGFYPRQVQVQWFGPGLQPVDKGDNYVLPNNDGTFQTRRSVILPGENPDTHSYSCVVHHSSVPGNITKIWVPDGRDGLPVWIAVICVTSVFLAIGTGFLLRRIHRANGGGI